MRTNVGFFVLVLASTLAAQESGSPQKSQPSSNPANSTLSLNQAVTTNQDVTGMLKAGISPEIVAAKIRNSKCQCDTSPAALGELKSAGVPDNVILAMVNSAAPPPSGLDDIRQARSVYLVDKGTDTGVFNHLSERLQKWGRWKIVTRPEQADLTLVFTTNQAYFGSMSTASVTSSASGTGMSFPLISLPRFLIAIDRASGRQLLAVKGSTPTPLAATLLVCSVNRLRKQVEKPEQP